MDCFPLHHFADRDAACYEVAIDTHGKVAWKSKQALAAHVVAVVTEAVADDYLAYLQSIDGRGDHPASFEVSRKASKNPTCLTLASAEIQDGGSVWLRYKRQ
jgi:hypothetical protein